MVQQYFPFYIQLDRCQYGTTYLYSKILQITSKKVDLTDVELENLLCREYDETKDAISE